MLLFAVKSLYSVEESEPAYLAAVIPLNAAGDGQLDMPFVQPKRHCAEQAMSLFPERVLGFAIVVADSAAQFLVCHPDSPLDVILRLSAPSLEAPADAVTVQVFTGEKVISAAPVLDAPRLVGVSPPVVHHRDGEAPVLRYNVYNFEVFIVELVTDKIPQVLLQLRFKCWNYSHSCPPDIDFWHPDSARYFWHPELFACFGCLPNIR
jgi:hypothetical protein